MVRYEDGDWRLAEMGSVRLMGFASRISSTALVVVYLVNHRNRAGSLLQHLLSLSRACVT